MVFARDFSEYFFFRLSFYFATYTRNSRESQACRQSGSRQSLTGTCQTRMNYKCHKRMKTMNHHAATWCCMVSFFLFWNCRISNISNANVHIQTITRQSQKNAWIYRTFKSRDKIILLTLWKYLLLFPVMVPFKNYNF